MNEKKITALYERLSKGDDERSGESISIQNQKLGDFRHTHVGGLDSLR